MVEWPGRCGSCHELISDWAGAGFSGRRWVHKSCWREGQHNGSLRSPLERGVQLELPMMASLLLFHFGLATALAGWVLLTQGETVAGAVTLSAGLVTPLIGAAGIALTVLSRRRIELVRLDLDAHGGWRAEQ